MGRVKMPWGSLEIGAQKQISLGLVKCLQSERNLYHDSIKGNTYKKDMKYKVQNDKNINNFDNNDKNINNFDNNDKNINNFDNNDNSNYSKNNININNGNQNEENDGKDFIAKNRFIRHSKECLSVLCKLGVTYDYLSVQLLQELIFVSTDLMNIYVRSVNENERNSVEEVNDKNLNKLDANSIFENDVITSKVSTGEKNIPPATLAAASLHWLSQMKIQFHALQVPHKNTVLRYLETVLHYSTKKEKSGISFPFLMSILTNLKISGIQWIDFDDGVKEKFNNFDSYIEIMKNENTNKYKNKNEIENEIENKNKENFQNQTNVNFNNGEETVLMNKNDEKNTLELYSHKYENFIKSMNVPESEKNNNLELQIKIQVKDDKLKNGGDRVDKKDDVNMSENLIYRDNDRDVEKEKDAKKEKEKEEEEEKIKMKDNENEKLLHRLSLRVAALPDSDLLRVVFLLGHRKISLKQLRLTHTSNVALVRENTILKTVKINTDLSSGVYPHVSDLEPLTLMGSESYEVKESLLDVLDCRLETVLKDLSPGKHAHIHAYTRTHTCEHTHIETHTCAHTYTHMHTHAHTHMRTYIHTYTHTHTHTCAHINTHMHTHIHTHIHAHIHTHMNRHTRTHTRTHMHTHMRTCTHINTHTHTHMHTYKHTHAHTYTHLSTPRIHFNHRSTLTCSFCILITFFLFSLFV